MMIRETVLTKKGLENSNCKEDENARLSKG